MVAENHQEKESSDWNLIDFIRNSTNGGATARTSDTSSLTLVDIIRGYKESSGKNHEDDIPDTIHHFKEEPSFSTSHSDSSSAGLVHRQRNPSRFSAFWSKSIYRIHRPILYVLHRIASVSARFPKSTILLSIFASLMLIGIGFLTNFELIVDEAILWTPVDSKAHEHRSWIDDESGFPADPRNFLIAVHANGENVLGRQSIELVFEMLDTFRALPGYEKLCSQSLYIDRFSKKNTCKIHGVTRFWNHSMDVFQESVRSDAEAILDMSAKTFPDGTYVSEDDIFGFPQRDLNDTLVSARMYQFIVELPDLSTAEDFEKDALDLLVDDMRVAWQNDDSYILRIEAVAERSFADEMTRAISNDIPLLPFVFVIMTGFTCSVFFKKDRVKSRTILGLCGVISVFLAIMAGYGLLFICAVPFTNMTPLIPFVVFGVGIDDTFILSACFERTDPARSPEERIHDTIEWCGLSVFLTTVTSATAFGLGCLSSVPAIFWLCLYAAPTICLVLVYQLTYFVACIVLDERRISEKRNDWCSCRPCCEESTDELQEPKEAESAAPEASPEREIPRSEVLMESFAKCILEPHFKVVIIAGFIAFGVACGFSASQLEQKFNYKDVIPSDSYATAFYEALEDYSSRSGAIPYVYFRNVDQSNKTVQRQMDEYVAALINVDFFGVPPPYYWLDDFRVFNRNLGIFSNISFNEKLDIFLQNPVYRDLYGTDIVRDSGGNIAASRTMLHIGSLDWEDIGATIDALEDQRTVSASQPMNEGHRNWPFFSYCFVYDNWEFSARLIDELVTTTVMSIVSVTGLALLLIPHWTGFVVILPLIALLYVDLMGVLQWLGVYIDPVCYFAVLLSIGLMVDYLMHILLKYYESAGTRKERVVEALRTMGVSILCGGISTFLGTLPLAFSTSPIFLTLFYAFIALVTLGCAHGLILLPVILSLVGPENVYRRQ